MTKKGVRTINEGECCDAVLSYLEQRLGLVRHDLTFPEQEGHDHPVEVTAALGDVRYAIEHTLIEPFDDQVHLEESAGLFLSTIEAKVSGHVLSGEHYLVEISITALEGRRRREH